MEQSFSVAILSGGSSSERIVSLQSGAAVQAALTRCGHSCRTIDPQSTDLESVDWAEFDVAFIALHGSGGEDGLTQAFLEDRGVAFTGSDSEASASAFSKCAAKQRFAECGLLTPDAVPIHEFDSAQHIFSAAARVGFPLIVKPDAQGSSLGVSIVQQPYQLAAALNRCFQYGAAGLLESAIEGEEWTVSVLDDEPLIPIRVETRRGFYDYQAKYHDEATLLTVVDSKNQRLNAALRRAARDACRALNTRGAARADFRVDILGRGWLLEVNTVPGLTDHSLLPRAAVAEGISFDHLCERMLQSALAASGRHNGHLRRVA